MDTATDGHELDGVLPDEKGRARQADDRRVLAEWLVVVGTELPGGPQLSAPVPSRVLLAAYRSLARDMVRVIEAGRALEQDVAELAARVSRRHSRR